MKQILLAAAMLLSIGFTAKAQTTASNTTDCNIEVTVHCYDALCNLVSSTGPIFIAMSGGTVSLPACNPGDFTVFEVCWAAVLGHGCGAPPSCAMVDGTPGGVPAPCGTGTFTGQIQSCDVCNNGGDGIGHITYNPISNRLSITK